MENVLQTEYLPNVNAIPNTKALTANGQKNFSPNFRQILQQQ